MERWIITGIIQVCIRSRWAEGGIRVEVRGMDRESAIAAALELHQRAAERQDPQALVRWHTPEMVRAERVRGVNDWQV